MKRDLVSYVCRASVHSGPSRQVTVATGSPVTVYEGEWAYCQAGARADHEWRAIEPVSLTELRLVTLVRRRELVSEDLKARP